MGLEFGYTFLREEGFQQPPSNSRKFCTFDTCSGAVCRLRQGRKRGYYNRLKTMEALVPPKPNEFDMAAWICSFTALFGM